MSEGSVHLSVTAGIATLVFDRPAARNAMTWSMYQSLAAHCESLAARAGEVRVAVLRGAGGQAFVAGTDIAQFRDFAGGDDGVAYERRIDAGIGLIEALAGAYLGGEYKLLATFIVLVACLLYTSPSPRDKRQSRMPSSA